MIIVMVDRMEDDDIEKLFELSGGTCTPGVRAGEPYVAFDPDITEKRARQICKDAGLRIRKIAHEED